MTVNLAGYVPIPKMVRKTVNKPRHIRYKLETTSTIQFDRFGSSRAYVYSLLLASICDARKLLPVMPGGRCFGILEQTLDLVLQHVTADLLFVAWHPVYAIGFSLGASIALGSS